MLRDEYDDYHQIYTDASKQEGGKQGVAVTDMRKIRACERLPDLFPIF